MGETKAKKNNDYADSAVNLTNNAIVKDLLDKYLVTLEINLDLMEKVKLATPDLQLQIAANQSAAADFFKQVKEAVDGIGSYQDVEAGHYAVKMAVKHVVYDPEAFEKHFPGYASAVIDITKSINKDSLKGLIKGEKIIEEALENAKIVTKSETYRYIIQ
jgi:hypothetical protein